MFIFLLGLSHTQNPGYIIVSQKNWYIFAINREEGISKEQGSNQSYAVHRNIPELPHYIHLLRQLYLNPDIQKKR